MDRIIVSLTGFPKNDEKGLVTRLRSFGARYNPSNTFDPHSGQVTLVVANCDNSNKIKAAHEGNIPIVSVAWIGACMSQYKSDPSSLKSVNLVNQLIKNHPFTSALPTSSTRQISAPPPAIASLSSLKAQSRDRVVAPDSNSSRDNRSNSNGLRNNARNRAYEKVLECFPLVPPSLIRDLMNGSATVIHISLLTAKLDADIPKLIQECRTKEQPFRDVLHLLQCLTVYHTFILTRLKYQYEASGSTIVNQARNFNELLGVLIQNSAQGAFFSENVELALHHLKLSLGDAMYDFKSVYTKRPAQAVVVRNLRNVEVDLNARRLEDDQAKKLVFKGLLEDFKVKMENISSFAALSALVQDLYFEQLFSLESGGGVGDRYFPYVHPTLFQLIQLSPDIWLDIEFWGLLMTLSNIPCSDELSAFILFGNQIPSSKGILFELASSPTSTNPLPPANQEQVFSLLDLLLARDENKERVLDPFDAINKPIPLLVTSLRNGSWAIVQYLTEELNIVLSRVISPSDGGYHEVECAWALLETARSGSYELLQELLSPEANDVWCSFDPQLHDAASQPELSFQVSKFLNVLNESASVMMRVKLEEYGFPSLPPWQPFSLSTTLLTASLGNPRVFFSLLQSLSGRDLERICCRVQVQWFGNLSEFDQLTPFDVALLYGCVEEAKCILETLIMKGMDKDALYHPELFRDWLVWMVDCQVEPNLPSSYHVEEQDSVSQLKSWQLIKDIMALLGVDGLMPVIEKTEWSASFPYGLYARDWLSSSQMKAFMDMEDFFSEVGAIPVAAHVGFLCWAAWRFHVEILIPYLNEREIQLREDILSAATENESWLHLLSQNCKADSSFKYAEGVMRAVAGPSIFTALDCRGKSVRDAWASVQVPFAEKEQVDKILAFIDKRVKEQGDIKSESGIKAETHTGIDQHEILEGKGEVAVKSEPLNDFVEIKGEPWAGHVWDDRGHESIIKLERHDVKEEYTEMNDDNEEKFDWTLETTGGNARKRRAMSPLPNESQGKRF
ncbi:hypothetical protein BDR26DRAFT_850055 [Obelidium mucronatum]|nr:hypothetical protein BDR26DRAFT_850055 [Obelidium mucronatum]